jgi:multiple sugar transport system permease protein
VTRGRLLVVAALGVWAFVSLVPLLWMVYGALLVPEALQGGVPAWPPHPDLFSTENLRALSAHARLGAWIMNSVLVAVGACLAQVLSSAGLAYVLAKHRFPGRAGVILGVGLLMAVPGQVLVVPLFVLVASLGLVDSLWGVVLPAAVTPFGIFLMYSRMSLLPDELLDAARVDGCGELGIFMRVALPLAAPAAATLAIFTFVGQWNSFLWPLLVLFSTERYTLSVGLATLQGQHEVAYGLLFAGAAISALPMVAIFLVFQRYFARGPLAGAVKG